MHEYEVIQELGSGSFGRVVKVRRRDSTGDIYAMKQIKMTNLSAKEKDAALNEVRLLASIDSPTVIKYKGAFYDQVQNMLCILMEFANGGDLTSLIDKKKAKNYRFSENFIWQVAYDILKGLNVLHSNKIFHRDIKPQNIFFVDSYAKLGDLNVSKVVEGNFAMTQAGTPYYTSPEIWNSEKYDSKCDIWSMGCLLYEMCSLRPPFMAKDFPGLSKKVCAGAYDPIPSFYSSKLAYVIKKCLTVSPYSRASVSDLLKIDIFNQISKEDYGEVDLLSTIKLPRHLTLLNRMLPEDQFDASRKQKSTKTIDLHNEPKSGRSMSKNPRSVKKIMDSPEIIYKEKQNYKIEALNAPVNSAKGVQKLPKINSRQQL